MRALRQSDALGPARAYDWHVARSERPEPGGERVFNNDLFNPDNYNQSQEERRRAGGHMVLQAHELYEHERARAQVASIWAWLFRRPTTLPPLGAVADERTIRSRHALGRQTIRLDKIYGSEGRSADFDSSFRPTQEHTRARWLGVALAMIQGRSMPPIEVIELGGRYFVRDGHHRVSAARALGQVDIEADVTVWEVDAPPAEACGCAAVGGA